MDGGGMMAYLCAGSSLLISAVGLLLLWKLEIVARFFDRSSGARLVFGSEDSMPYTRVGVLLGSVFLIGLGAWLAFGVLWAVIK